MPATYRHVHTYEQITGRGRNAWKRPEPQPDKLTIFGHEVEPSVFKKYNHQNYSVGFVFRDLAGVEKVATDPYYAANYPEWVDEAKQIMQKIVAEITGKEENTMKDPRTAAGFIDALKDIYAESRDTYDSIRAKVERAEAKMNKAQEKAKASGNDAVAEAEYSIAKGERTLAEQEARNGYRSMIANHEAKVQELREQFAAFLDEHYAASPDRLDDKTMALLNSGICTPSELSRLIERHHDNPVMVRIIGNYARNMREEKKKSLSYEDKLICSTVAGAGHAAKDGSRELALYDSAVSAAAYGLGKDYKHATRMHSYVTGWLDDLKSQVVNLPLTPAEQSEPVQD